MSRWPFSISPSMAAMLVAPELLLQPQRVDDVPVLGELAVLDAPDVDGAQREAPAGRSDALQWLRMRSREAHARDHLVAGNDAVLDPRMDVRHAREDAAKVF